MCVYVMHVFWGVSEEKGEFFLEGTWFGGLDTGEEMSILGHGHGSRDLDAQPCTAMHSHATAWKEKDWQLEVL